jgi:signal transduction histidine kinase
MQGQENHAELKRQSLTAEIAPDLPRVLGNSLRLGQSVSNLISNAIKYTPEEGHIAVTAGIKDSKVVVKIQDNGIGISQEDLPHVFEKFFRVDRPETENIIGSGLGLSIVKTIVEKHGGRVWVESELGEGTTFAIVLPPMSDYAPTPNPDKAASLPGRKRQSADYADRRRSEEPQTVRGSNG